MKFFELSYRLSQTRRHGERGVRREGDLDSMDSWESLAPATLRASGVANGGADGIHPGWRTKNLGPAMTAKVKSMPSNAIRAAARAAGGATASFAMATKFAAGP